MPGWSDQPLVVPFTLAPLVYLRDLPVNTLLVTPLAKDLSTAKIAVINIHCSFMSDAKILLQLSLLVQFVFFQQKTPKPESMLFV